MRRWELSLTGVVKAWSRLSVWLEVRVLRRGGRGSRPRTCICRVVLGAGLPGTIPDCLVTVVPA